MNPHPEADLQRQHAAAHGSAVVCPISDRTWLRVTGRAPSQMLSGLLAGAMPADLRDVGEGWHLGRAPCSAMLTPKGRMITDMRVRRLGAGPEGTLLLDLPSAGLPAAHEHFRRYLPPRMAQVEVFEPSPVALALVGPSAVSLLAPLFGKPPPGIGELVEDDELVLGDGSESGLRIVRSEALSPNGFDLLGTRESIQALLAKLARAGATPAGDDLRTLLRIERGRPVFGAEMDEDTMPGEAGILDRCVETSKGCFTGQEVVVRIRDRGHVNRHLRGLLLEEPLTGSLPLPLYGTEGDRLVGDIRSAVRHPRLPGALALGFVRRELEPPCRVRVGSADGPLAEVRALDRDGWRLEKGDPSFYP